MCPGQVPDLRRAITPGWEGPLVHEPSRVSFNFNNVWDPDLECTYISGANKMEMAWFSSFQPLYRRAIDGAVVFQEAHLAQAWALTETDGQPQWGLGQEGASWKALWAQARAGTGRDGAEHGLEMGARQSRLNPAIREEQAMDREPDEGLAQHYCVS